MIRVTLLASRSTSSVALSPGVPRTPTRAVTGIAPGKPIPQIPLLSPGVSEVPPFDASLSLTRTASHAQTALGSQAGFTLHPSFVKGALGAHWLQWFLSGWACHFLLPFSETKLSRQPVSRNPAGETNDRQPQCPSQGPSFRHLPGIAGGSGWLVCCLPRSDALPSQGLKEAK